MREVDGDFGGLLHRATRPTVKLKAVIRTKGTVEQAKTGGVRATAIFKRIFSSRISRFVYSP